MAAVKAVSIALHDVAPGTWPICQRLITMLDERGPVPLTLLVVPDYHRRGRIDRNADFLRAMEKRLARGDEIALHGYYHLDESAPARNPSDWWQRRVMTDREGEFAALSAAEAGERLEWGLELMRRLGWPTSGFVAPAWLMGAGARRAITDYGFAYTTTRAGIFRLPEWQFTGSAALAYSVRSGVRRSVSLAFAPLRFRSLVEAPLLRLALHPVDARFADVMAQWRRIIETALETRVPLTKAAWAADK